MGSLPGTDPFEAAAVVAGELPDWPHLPELPARGAGADMIGRAMQLLAAVSAEFAVETSAGRWRRCAAPGRDLRRAASFFRADCDAAEDRFSGYAGPFTVAVAGPWTLAASVLDERGERCLRDRGYVADLCQAHAAAAGALVHRLRRMLPGARVVVTIDEPMLAAVHDGEVPFSSGYRRHRAVPADEIVAGLQRSRDAVRGAGGLVGLHTCAAPVWPVLHGLAPDHLSLDAALLVAADTEHLGTWLESGAGLVWGVWPTGAAPRDQADRATGLITNWLDRLGTSPSRCRGPMAVSPRCGLAGATPAQALAAMAGVRGVAARLAETQ